MSYIITKTIQTPIARFIAGVFNNKICLFEFTNRRYISDILVMKSKQYGAHLLEGDHELFEQLKKELHEYFLNKRTEFTLPLDIRGTKFQKLVWNELMKIPYGETISYSELANRIGNPSAVRAVGRANGSNNIALIIPCHRVIDKSGELRGYGGGIQNKKKLLELESTAPLLQFF